MHATKTDKYSKHLRETAAAVRAMGADELRSWKKRLVDDLVAVRDGRKPKSDPDRGIDDLEKELSRVLGQVKSRLAYFERIEAKRPDLRKEVEEGTTIFHRQLREAYAEVDELEAAGGNADHIHARIHRLWQKARGGPHIGDEPASADEIAESRRGSRRYSSL